MYDNNFGLVTCILYSILNILELKTKEKWVIRIVFLCQVLPTPSLLIVNDVSYFGTNGLVPLMVRTVVNEADLFTEL